MTDKSLVDIIAAVPAVGSHGNVGHEAAERIAAAIEAATAKVPIDFPPPPKPKVEPPKEKPPESKPTWRRK